ncbi:MAG: hypothetical protein ACLVJB_06920 [Christensenellales bacterium]
MDGKRHIITIAAIGPDSGQTLTLGVYDALRQADALLLRTGRHGVADRLRQEGVAFETLDALYDRTEDFDELLRAGRARDYRQGDRRRRLSTPSANRRATRPSAHRPGRCRTTWRSGCWAA